jgi:hypothetical protein
VQEASGKRLPKYVDHETPAPSRVRPALGDGKIGYRIKDTDQVRLMTPASLRDSCIDPFLRTALVVRCLGAATAAGRSGAGAFRRYLVCAQLLHRYGGPWNIDVLETVPALSRELRR